MKERLHLSQWIGSLKERRLIALWVAVAIGVSGSLVWALLPERHHITVEGLDTSVAFWSTEKSLGAALQTGGVQVGAKDQVSPPLETSLKGMPEVTVRIKKAIPVVVAVDGKRIETESAVATVGDLLSELSVQLNPNDGVSLDLAQGLQAGMEVTIVRRTETVEWMEEEIPFETEQQADYNMDAGRTRLVQAGEPGIKRIQQVTYLEDGQPVKVEVLQEVVVKEPVPEVIAYGTAGVVSRGGQDYRYSRALEMSATGYTAGKESNPNGNGYTYTGMKAVRGVVAVDPNVIPLYSRLYIEGYGPAVAGDIGGAVRGNKIDLCFDSVQEALDWGRRTVTVYVLND